MKYEGIYGGSVVQCFPLKLKFQVDPGVRGFGYKVSVEVTNSGYSITTDKGMSLKILSIEPFEFDESQKKINRKRKEKQIDYYDLKTFISIVETYHKDIEEIGGKDILLGIDTVEGLYDSSNYGRLIFTYNILETDEECYNRIRREEKVKKENEDRDRRLFESLKERFGE